MLGLLIILAGCGNKETAPEKQKEITMTDIIKSSKILPHPAKMINNPSIIGANFFIIKTSFLDYMNSSF
jgi:hypothetical protein